MAGIKITGYGHEHGECSVSNEDLQRYVDTNDEWIQEKTGIKNRYFAKN